MDQPPLPPQILPIEARWCLDQHPQRCIALEVADQPDEQQRGLMQRPALPPLQGMWFPARPSQPMRFWMLHTLAPLDMLFIRGGRVLDIAANVPVCAALPCPSYWADADANGRADFVDGVIELGAGEALRLEIQPGDAATIESIGAH